MRRGGGLAARPRPRRPGATLALPLAGSLQAARPAQAGRGCGGGRAAAALPPGPGAAPRERGRSRRGNLRNRFLHTCVCLSVSLLRCVTCREPTAAAAEGCRAGGAPERGGSCQAFHRRFRSAPKREGRVDPLDLSRLSGLNPQLAGLDCLSSQEMSLVVAA